MQQLSVKTYDEIYLLQLINGHMFRSVFYHVYVRCVVLTADDQMLRKTVAILLDHRYQKPDIKCEHCDI